MFKTSSNKINDDVLSDNFEDITIRRGRKYHQAGRVLNLSVFDDMTYIESQVKGRARYPYNTIIYLFSLEPSDRIDIKGECSCPQSFNCKHVVATLLAVRAKYSTFLLQAYEPSHKTEFTSVSNELNQWFKMTLSEDHQNKPFVSEPHHLLYVLQPRLTYRKKIEVTLQISRLLKKGGYGKPKKYSSSAKSHQQYLQSVDEDIIAGLQFINRQSFSFSQTDNSFDFNHHQKNSTYFEMILKTGRCFWGGDLEHPMSFGEKQVLEFKWELLPNACQTLAVLVGGQAADIFILDKIWYVDLINKKCGVVETQIPIAIVEKLIKAPQVPPELTTNIAKHIRDIAPQHKQLQPTIFGTPILQENIEPIPEMRLNMKPMHVPANSNEYLYHAPQATVDVPVAEIFFNYGSQVVPFSFQNSSEIITYINEGKLHAIKRQFAKEKEFLLGLNEYMQLEMLGGESEKGCPTTLHITSIETTDDFFEFAMVTVPQLEHQGWRMVREHSAFLRIIREEEISWYSELDEESEYDYFSLKIGITINDEHINILPLIVQVMQSMDIEEFKTLSDDDVVPLPLSDGRVFLVPYIRIKPMLSVLVELYDADTLDNSDSLKLLKQQAALLHEIEKAFKVTQLRWLGGERLRKLGEKLSKFTSISTVKPPKTFRGTLRQYQQDGLNWLQFLREYQLGGVLADDMGLGKTVQTLAHLSIEKNKNRMKKPSLIIAPTSLMVNWCLEAAKFTPNLKVLIFHGDHRHAQAGVMLEHDVILTTYPLLVRDKETLLNHEYYYLILDEAQCIKNHKAKSTQIVQQLKAEHRLCVTGTPMENHLGELWSLFHFLMPGFLGDSAQFKKLFRTPIEKYGDEDRRKALASRMKPFMLRRQKKEVLMELPDKTEIIRTVELQGPERDLYESIRLSMEKKVRDAIRTKGLARSHIVILDALLKLRQTCCHPRLLKLTAAKKAHAYSAKLDWLTDVLPKMVEEGRKIILFSQFTSMLKIIEEMLEKKGLDYVKLIGSTKNRIKPIESFQQGKVSIFLVSLKAGGTGLNLTAADTVIHYDPWWNPAVEDQATDRAHRIGQKKSVFVYKLLASGTVEETIQEMQQKKRQLMEGLFSEQSQGKIKLTADDLGDLFKPLESVT